MRPTQHQALTAAFLAMAPRNTKTQLLGREVL